MSGQIDIARPAQAVRESRESSDSQPSEESSAIMWFCSISSWFQNLNKKNAVVVLILCFVNFINYMDRSTIAGMMEDIKHDQHFNIKSDKAMGLLQTAFVICYMIFAPIFGYLGDRYKRTWIMILGLTLWSLATFIGSFMQNFWAFLFFRALVGIGEASYSTIAPAIISDLFTKDTRSRVLALFYFAIPVGTGLGYILGSEIAQVCDWRWGLRVTPFMGALAIISIVILMEDPERGQAENAHSVPGSPKDDLKALAKNKSFMLAMVGFTCVTFTAGCLMWWGPEFAYLGAKAACGAAAGCEKITEAEISSRFGIVMALAGLLGVPLGSFIAQAIRHKIPNADPLVCGSTLLLSVPVIFFGFYSARYNIQWTYGLVFFGGLLLNCNWSVVSDITLYIVIPTRRSIASATIILASHALGDAISPYLIGAIADAIRPNITPVYPIEPITDNTPEYFEIEFRCKQYALFLCCFFQLAGAFAFMVMSWYVLEDKQAADRFIAETSGDTADNTPIVANIEDED